MADTDAKGAAGKVVVRTATAADIAHFAANANLPATPTILAWVGELTDAAGERRLIGIGGLAILGGHYRAFCDLTPEAEPFRMTLMRTARRAMAHAKRVGIRYVHAEPQADMPGAARWLESLGFEPDRRSAGTLWRWHS